MGVLVKGKKALVKQFAAEIQRRYFIIAIDPNLP